ncbi:hypothetical protein BS47DRAFT_1368470 [Hydnum rufescens UP504]|uniref:Uncharacterized protein n=1 Tax=Hydnum rufescens UP504 TaxID=1448309 RepID=A0A9P6AH77_9AGAM|nr:hypothetical protein BS47DRAFT_1368470 [Hydnum rufescens UP504]
MAPVGPGTVPFEVQSPLCENPPNVNTDNAPHENTKTHNHQRPMTDPTTGKAQYHTPAMAGGGNTCCPLQCPKPHNKNTPEVQNETPMHTATCNPIQNPCRTPDQA